MLRNFVRVETARHEVLCNSGSDGARNVAISNRFLVVASSFFFSFDAGEKIPSLPTIASWFETFVWAIVEPTILVFADLCRVLLQRSGVLHHFLSTHFSL